MALDDLIARLEQDADAQVDAIAQAADAEVTAIAAATAQALADRSEQTRGAQRMARRGAHARELADRRRAMRATELAATHAALDRIFARARALLPDLTRADDWTPLWPALAEEALSYLPGVACRLRCAPELAAILRSRLSVQPRVTLVEDPSMGPGIIVETDDRSVTIDGTLAGRLEQRRHQLAIGLLDQDGRHG